MIPQNNTPRPAQSFGSVQENFRYRMANFNSGEQFTIVEDMPRNKPVRLESKRMTGDKNGRHYDFDAQSYLIRIVSKGYEADIELKPKEFMTLAVLCPKDTQNFKGTTFVFDGYNWAYMGIEAPQAPISNISQAMTPPRDPRQPDLNPAPDQRDLFVSILVKGISALTSRGTIVDTKTLLDMCENMMPGDALNLFQYGKNKGSYHEENGVWKVN